jgi:hypothetical protein
MERLGGSGMVAIALEEAFECLHQFGSVSSVVIFQLAEVLSAKILKRLSIFDLSDDAIDAEIGERYCSVAAEELPSDSGGLLGLNIGLNDLSGTRGPPSHTYGRCHTADQAA